MHLIVIAGTHAAACGGIRRQILAGAELMYQQGVHVPKSYNENPRTWHNLAWELGGTAAFRAERGRFADAVSEAKASGAEHLLLMSEEFESAAMEPRAVDRLSSTAKDLGGRATLLLVFRHQLSYLNLVFGLRAVNGLHGTWFEDFVRAPTPPRQFDYLDVIDRFAHDARVDLTPCALDDVVAGGGIAWLLDRAGAAVSMPDVPELEVESPPGRITVLSCLMAHRLAVRRDVSRDPQAVRLIVHQLGLDLAEIVPDGGPFWGWTDDLVAELLPRFTEVNARLQDRHGLLLVPDEAPPDATDLHLRDIDPGGVKALLERLDAATRLAFPDPG